MATKQSTVDFLTEQIQKAGNIRSRKMFGEYAIYCDEKVIALVCDDQLFVKPTDAGRKFLMRVTNPHHTQEQKTTYEYQKKNGMTPDG